MTSVKEAKKFADEPYVSHNCEYLIGEPFRRTKNGSWGVVHGNKFCALSAHECEVLGKKPGPDNL